MSFTGNENHLITLAEASAMTANYRASVAAGATIAHYFGKTDIEAIFNQAGCVGMRVYYAIDGNGAKQLVVVGVDANENDLYNGLIADRGSPCPAYCSTPNPLNS